MLQHAEVIRNAYTPANIRNCAVQSCAAFAEGLQVSMPGIRIPNASCTSNRVYSSWQGVNMVAAMPKKQVNAFCT